MEGGSGKTGTKGAVFSPHAGTHPNPGGTIRTLIVSLLGAAALTAGLLAFRHQRQANPRPQVHAGETVGQMASLERLRELGL